MAYITDKEFENLLHEVLKIVENSESKEDAIEKLLSLIKNK